MSLAILEFEEGNGSEIQFRMDLGSNRYWSYTIGDKEVLNQHGIKVLQNKNHSSHISGPLPENTMGRGILRVPADLFDRKNHFIQLISFRDEKGNGPAVSDISSVPLSGISAVIIPGESNYKENIAMNQTINTIPCKVKESQMSEAMFLGALTSIIPKVLPIAGNILGGLFGGKGGGGIGNILGGLFGGGNKGGGASGVSNILEQILKPESIQKITDLLQQVTNVAQSQQPAAAPAVTAKSLSFSGNGYHRFTSGSNKKYMSNAMVAPALLAALPALMPLLEKVMNPQTIKAIGENLGPEKTIAAVTDSVKEIGNLGLKGQQQLMSHLEAVHPKTDPLDAIIASMSMASGIELPYRRSESVKINFPELQTHMLFGRSRIIYQYGRDLSFPVDISTPQTISKAILQLTIKDSETLEILDQKKWRVENVSNGSLQKVPVLSAERLSGIKPGEDYIITVSLYWKNKAGKRIGTSRKMLITLVREYSFDRVEEGGEPVALDNPTNYREFWHKLWQGTFNKEFKSLKFSCRYYYLLDEKQHSNARMETLTILEKDGIRKQNGKLKSGMSLSIDTLSRLIPQISTFPIPANEELDALNTPDFRDRFQQAAKTDVNFAGRDGENVVLWVYPVVKLQKIILKKSMETDNNGHITEMTEHEIFFPMPVITHFVGLITEV